MLWLFFKHDLECGSHIQGPKQFRVRECEGWPPPAVPRLPVKKLLTVPALCTPAEIRNVAIKDKTFSLVASHL